MTHILLPLVSQNATAHKVNSYYTLAILYCRFCVGKRTISGLELYRIKTLQVVPFCFLADVCCFMFYITVLQFQFLSFHFPLKRFLVF